MYNNNTDLFPAFKGKTLREILDKYAPLKSENIRETQTPFYDKRTK